MWVGIAIGCLVGLGLLVGLICVLKNGGQCFCWDNDDDEEGASGCEMWANCRQCNPPPSPEPSEDEAKNRPAPRMGTKQIVSISSAPLPVPPAYAAPPAYGCEGREGAVEMANPAHVVTRRRFRTNAPNGSSSVGYRNSKNYNDRARPGIVAKDGAIVTAVVVEEDWLQLADGYWVPRHDGVNVHNNWFQEIWST